VDCWKACDKQPGKCGSGFCGANAGCCRQGDNDCGESDGSIGCDGFHCCSSLHVEYVDNLGRDCWDACGNAGGACPSFCGSGGGCCRKKEGGCGLGDPGCDGFHCCTQMGAPAPAPPTGVSNYQANCWEACDEKAGFCPGFCGDDGGCCRQGDNDCGTGTNAGTGCDGYHCFD
jgi:hypothetical protein